MIQHCLFCTQESKSSLLIKADLVTMALCENHLQIVLSALGVEGAIEGFMARYNWIAERAVNVEWINQLPDFPVFDKSGKEI